jgi:plasmid maintenance system antidote protein VapI
MMLPIGNATNRTGATMGVRRNRPLDLADQLRPAIAGCGMSLNQLAEAAGVHKAQLSRFMRAERSLTLPAAAKLCTYLGLRLTGPALDEKD